MTVAALKPARSARKPKGEGHARRAEILEAAERIFVQCGYEGATIRKIADEVGVSSTALYMHFRDKSEILHEICEAAFQRLLAFNIDMRQRDLPPAEKVRRMMDAYVQFGFENPNAYRLVFLTRPQEAEETQSVAQRLGREVYDQFEACVEQLASVGKLKTGVREAAQVLWAGGHGIVALLITKPYFDWAPAEVLSRTMLDALFEGLVRQ
ncbi:MAG TPA: TetR/AcrR family transcriptional regulator [Caulobacteraceae bacterium]|nr:TetR/AcrR family transcriptional regulator [Caulobacteraceae bacterium]